MRALGKDLRFALRSLAKSPGFTSLAVATLALGIGANTAIFSLVDAVLLRPLPYPRPERLVTMADNVSALELSDLQARTRSFSGLGGAVAQPLDLTGEREPLQVSALLVAGDYFEVLGARAEEGRVLRAADDAFGGERVAVVSHAMWRQHWGGDRSLVGRRITLGGLPTTVVGILDRGFQPPREEADVFLPLRVAYPLAAQARGVHFLRTVFRLAPSATVASARADLGTVLSHMAAEHPDTDTGIPSELVSLLARVVGDSRLPLLVLSGAVTLVLLIACANLANLLLARSASRRHEMAIRTALGAPRGRLVRQLLTESVLLGVLGGGAGLLLAIWATELLLARAPGGLPRLAGVAIDARVVLFTAVLSVAAGIVFGLAPAWRSSGASLADALAASRRTAGLDPGRLRGALIVAETALAMVLLVGAGLLINTLRRLQAVPPGFDARGLATARLDLPESRYAEVPAQTAFRERVLESLNAVPGARAAMVSEAPLGGNALNHDFVIEGRPPVPPGQEPSLYSRSVMGDYFRVMGIAVRAGRDFTPADRAGAPPVGIVNDRMAREYFPGGSPIGARIRWARDENVRWIEVVGVAADVNHFGLSEGEAPAVYTPYAQSDQPWKRWMDLVVRAPRGTDAASLVRRGVWAVDPLIPVARVRSMDDLVSESTARQRFQSVLLGTFAAAALALAAVGIYGVVWSSVRRRTSEIGIRIALGAPPRRVVRDVLVDGLRPVGAGLAIGAVIAAASSRAMASLLFGVRPTDPLTYASVALLLGAVAAAASYVPARRAAAVDPIVALREE